MSKASDNEICSSNSFKDSETDNNSIQTDITQVFDDISLADVSSEIIISSRIKYGNRWSFWKGIWYDYSRSTTIHGLHYVFSVHLPIYERLCWFVSTSISFYFAVYLIWDTYLKWQDSPVILSFHETLVPVHKIPFPTITICPEIKMEQKMFDFADMSERVWNEYQQKKDFENSENFTQEEFEYFAATLHICEEDVVNRFAQFVPETAQPDVAQTLVNLSISKNETGPFCKWNGRFYLCEKIFNYVPTDEGICYQFNGLHVDDIFRNSSDVSYYDPYIVDFQSFYDSLPPLNNITGKWSLEGGYVEQGYNSYPQRTVFSSVRNAFFAFLQGFEHNFEYACRNFKQGYRVYLNSPESVPLTSVNYISVPHGDEVMVSVLPQYVIGDESLREFSPEKRQCFFDDERYLRYFRHYSQSNCQTECLANFTIAKCSCAKFWMPKPPEIPVCAVKDIACYTNAQDELNMLLQNQTAQKTVDPEVKIMCDCMPSCTSLEYNVEISSALYDLAATLVALREHHDEPGTLTSRLSVYFKEHQFTAIKRTVLFSISTLIANFGGILGLFMGISSLSLVEFVYFFSMRLLLNLRMRRRIKKKLIKEEAGHKNGVE